MAEVKRIVVLEPDDVAAGALKRALEAEGFAVSVEDTPEEALDVVASGGADLLIVEARLPGKSGLDVLRDVHEAHPGMDVVMLTSEPSMEEARRARQLGALKYIERPFVPEFLLQTVRGAFERQGWVLRKQYIEQFKQYAATPGDEGDEVMYYKDGVWARPADKGRWEVGIDARHFYLEGQLLYVEHLDVQELRKGEPFARLLLGDAETRNLLAPMGGRVMERNPQANETMCNLARECLTENWALWLVRIESIDG